MSAHIRKYMATYMGTQLLELLYTQFINLLMSSQPKKMVRKGLETLEIPSGINNPLCIAPVYVIFMHQGNRNPLGEQLRSCSYSYKNHKNQILKNALEQLQHVFIQCVNEKCYLFRDTRDLVRTKQCLMCRHTDIIHFNYMYYENIKNGPYLKSTTTHGHT